MAQDLNTFIVIGRVTRDVGSAPDGRDFGYLQNGTCKAEVNIANNRARKDANGQWIDEVSYFSITLWGKTAENLKQYLVKGTQICATCYLKQDRWVDKEGKNQSRISIVAENVQLCGGKKQEAGFAPNTTYQTAQQAQQASAYAQQYAQQQARPQFTPQNQSAQQNFNGQPFPEDVPGNDYPEDIPF